jgi:hypothetical protein
MDRMEVRLDSRIDRLEARIDDQDLGRRIHFDADGILGERMGQPGRYGTIRLLHLLTHSGALAKLAAA